MDFNSYRNTLPYADGVPQPRIVVGVTTPEEAKRLLETYAQATMNDARTRKEYNTENVRLIRKFHDDALAEVGLTGHPKAEKAWAFAWDHGHSSGNREVFAWLQSAAELIQD